mmetsp:Transcript_48815/g.35927  ORF Transcript_48815/g.35927 Transcript_48815/m.35927 type:complete len:91 (+) Transcript_48815:155-427(+)
MMPSEERLLTVRNFLNFIWNSNEDDRELMEAEKHGNQVMQNIYIPINTVTPSEIEGLKLEEERKLRVFGCELIRDSTMMLKMPNIVSTTA